LIIYSQNPPSLSRSDKFIKTTCLYSGFEEGLNNPEKEDIKNIGPIPKGLYLIERWVARYPGKGPVVAILAPIGHDCHGRSGFLIHGDNQKMNHTASHGCIVTDLKTRQFLRDLEDIYLKVI